MKRALQYFSDEYLEHCKTMTPKQILQFLEDFKMLQSSVAQNGKSKLISIKIPENLLSVFKAHCKSLSVPYQSKIKELMRTYLQHI